MRDNLVQKWSEVKGKVAISDIEDKDIKSSLAQLLENQETQTLGNELNEATFSSSAPTSQETGQFSPIALALVRRTFPDLFANKVVPVQAMSGPVGLAYALRMYYKGTTNEAGFNEVPKYSGFTGSISGTSGTADSGTGVETATGEGWQLPPTSPATMPELTLALSNVAIAAKSRKLAASWSLEAAQDISAMHQIDIEREMVNVLQYEVMAELDRELIAKLKATVVATAKGGEAVTTVDITGTDGRWAQEKMSFVANTIIKKANDIATSTRRAAGNFVIVSPRVATALQAAKGWFTANEATVNATSTLTQVGSLNGTITVYRDSYATTDYALVGYKGPGQSDGGIIYSPYITGLVSKATAEEDFSPRIGVMTRYALTDSLLGAGRYYRYITFSNLSTVIGA